MFYVKLGEYARAEINDENVVTDCTVCGEQISVDLTEVLQGRDLCGTSIICRDCTAKRMGLRNA